MQIFIAAAPAEEREAGRYRRPLAHMAYHIGPDSTLLRHNLLLQTQGGLLGLTDHSAPEVADPESLVAAILRECGRRNYGGVLLDFDQPQRRDLTALTQTLDRRLQGGRRRLYLPPAYAGASPAGTVLVETALSGGQFDQYLQEQLQRRKGPSALSMQQMRMEFPLPCPSGVGQSLTEAQLQKITEEHRPSVFFSQDLCARYFTYGQGSQTRFVLYDDAATLRKKLQIGASLGYTAAFLPWAEIKDLASALFSTAK